MRSFSRGQTNAADFLRAYGNSQRRGQAANDATGRSRLQNSEALNRFSRETNRPQLSTGNARSTDPRQRPNLDARNSQTSPWSRGDRPYTAERSTNQQVRDFLDLRRRGDSSSALRTTGQTPGLAGRRFDADGRRFDADSDRRGIERRSVAKLPDNIRSWKPSPRGRFDDSRRRGDESWTRHFGDGKGKPAGSPRQRFGERHGDGNGRFGDLDRLGNGRGGTRRDIHDRDFTDRNYKAWRGSAWRGHAGRGFDHRDRSGRWKDGNRFAAAHRIRDHWRGHRHRDDLPFRGGWWSGHDRHRRHWHHWDHFASRHHRPYYWWNWCPAPRLTSWFTFNWGTPYYWDYGPGEYIYCYDNVIYVNGVWFQPAPAYHESTVVLAQRVPDWTAEQAAQVEWLPLGVFAVARDGVADANVLVQLAVTKEGVIGGTVFNEATGVTFAVQGSVDKETQRAVWSYLDATDQLIVMETSIYNLTQPEATGLIHYGPSDIQVIQLVRLEKPALDEAASQASPLPTTEKMPER